MSSLINTLINPLFSKALQKKTFDIEKNAIRNARASAFQLPKPPGSSSSNTGSHNSTLLFEDTFVNNTATQLQMQEDVNLHALEEQERAIRELEVIYHNKEIKKKISFSMFVFFCSRKIFWMLMRYIRN